jgi:anti-sigma factor RsiW
MDEQRKRNHVGERLKIFAGLAATVFSITLALVIGNRLSDEALAVLAGAVCGVGAAIPTSLLIVAVSRRRDESRVQPTTYQPAPQGAYPPVVVVAPPGGQQGPNAWNILPPSFNAPTQRHFTVVGGSSVDTEIATYNPMSSS